MDQIKGMKRLWRKQGILNHSMRQFFSAVEAKRGHLELGKGCEDTSFDPISDTYSFSTIVKDTLYDIVVSTKVLQEKVIEEAKDVAQRATLVKKKEKNKWQEVSIHKGTCAVPYATSQSATRMGIMVLTLCCKRNNMRSHESCDATTKF